MPKYVAESDRLWLQPLNVDEQLHDYHLYISNPEGMAWSPSLPSTSLEETRVRMATKALPTPENPTVENYAISLKSSVDFSENGKPKLIGTIGPYRVNPDAAQLGYGLHRDYWGKGYGTEALKLFIKFYWAPGRESKDTLTADVDPTNTASTNLVSKLEFKRGEHLKSVYQLGTEIRDGIETKRDVVVWRLERPKSREATK